MLSDDLQTQNTVHDTRKSSLRPGVIRQYKALSVIVMLCVGFSYAFMLQRDVERLQQLGTRADKLPLGRYYSLKPGSHLR